MKATIPLDLRAGTDGPVVERLEYVLADGSTYAATISQTIHRQWVASIWTGVEQVWVSPRSFRDRGALIRRCTEEVDREARRRRVG